jgi:hypothetical protein
LGLSSEHDADRRERGRSCEALEVAGVAPIVSKQAYARRLRLGARRSDAVHPTIVLQVPTLATTAVLRTLVRGVSEDTLDEGEDAACTPIEDACRSSERRRSAAGRACGPGYAVCGR